MKLVEHCRATQSACCNRYHGGNKRNDEKVVSSLYTVCNFIPLVGCLFLTRNYDYLFSCLSTCCSWPRNVCSWLHPCCVSLAHSCERCTKKWVGSSNARFQYEQVILKYWTSIFWMLVDQTWKPGHFLMVKTHILGVSECWIILYPELNNVFNVESLNQITLCEYECSSNVSKCRLHVTKCTIIAKVQKSLDRQACRTHKTYECLDSTFARLHRLVSPYLQAMQ